MTGRAWGSWRGRPLKWGRIAGLWYLRDRDVAWVLDLQVRVVNQRAKRNLELFPTEFGVRLRRSEADFYFPHLTGRYRQDGRASWAYTLAGMLQLKMLGRPRGLDWVRVLSAELGMRAGPIPPGLGLPPPPRPADELFLWAPAWATEEDHLPWDARYRGPARLRRRRS